MEAYTIAFQWTGSTIDACKAGESLLNIEEIQKRIEELQPFQIEPPLGEDMLTLGEHLRELYQLEKIAVRMGQLGPAVSAAIARGKASGLYVERSLTATVSLEDLIAGSRQDGTVSLPPASRRIADIGPRHSSGRELPPGPKSVKRSAR